MKTIVAKPSPDQNVNFRLFQTSKRGLFLKLDTRNGVITHVQYWHDEGRMEYGLNPPLVDKEDEKPGRFFLYPIEETDGFFLLDQISGNCYQVQRNIDKEGRLVWLIY